jgi:UDP-GlcNAc:undecaprenyl-phosphate GlcNAc-1-phosphate transferase
MNLLLNFIIALSVTMVLIPPLARLALRLNLVDQPSLRKVHSHPVPRVGGAAIVVGATLPIVLLLDVTPQVLGFLTASAVLLLFGLADDFMNLRWPIKLTGQVLAVGAVMFIGGVQVASWTPGVRELLPMWIAMPLSFVFLLGITNAINLADGLDGLAGGTTLLCFCALALLALAGADAVTASIALASIGAILGFLRFNTHPARIFMGDSGSQFLGLGVGVTAVVATQNPQSSVSAALPLLLLGLPVLDTLMVMVQRLLDGRSPFDADRNHIHHKLLALGFEHQEAVVAIYLLQCALFLAAYFLRFESDGLIMTVFGVFALAVISLLQWAQVRGWRWRQRQSSPRGSLLVRQLRWLRAPERLPHWALLFLCLCVPAYSLHAIARAVAVSPDVALLALGLLTLGLVVLPWMWSHDLGWIERGAIYVAAVLVVYLDQTSAGADATWKLGFFGLLACAVVVRFRLAHDRRFEVTPLDVLVIFIALVVPNLPGTLTLPPGLALGIAKIVVLLYAIEMMLTAGLRWNISRAVVAIVLVALAIRGLLPIVN